MEDVTEEDTTGREDETTKVKTTDLVDENTEGDVRENDTKVDNQEEECPNQDNEEDSIATPGLEEDDTKDDTKEDSDDDGTGTPVVWLFKSFPG